MSPFYEGSNLESLFSTRDPAYHRALKTPVSAIFSMTQMRNFESYADQCSDIFMAAMHDLQGTSVDLAEWLQWYAFDVIGAITFQRRFGFMDQRRDVDDMIKQIDGGLRYAGVVGQMPAWHPWLLGNRPLTNLLSKLIDLPNPIPKILKVCSKFHLRRVYQLTYNPDHRRSNRAIR